MPKTKKNVKTPLIKLMIYFRIDSYSLNLIIKKKKEKISTPVTMALMSISLGKSPKEGKLPKDLASVLIMSKR